MKRGNVNIIIYSHKHFYATRKCCCYSNLCVEEIYAFFSRKLHGKMHFYSVCVKVKNILDLSQHLISPDFIVQGATPLLFNLIYVNICKKYVCCEKKRRGRILQDQIQYCFIMEWCFIKKVLFDLQKLHWFSKYACINSIHIHVRSIAFFSFLASK